MTPATATPLAPAPAIVTVEVPTLGEHTPAWDALVVLATTPSPFLLSWWLEPHEATAGARYVLVLEGEELLGGLATVVDRRWGLGRVRLLGAGSLAPDHLDLVAVPERRADVVTALAAWFHRRSGLIDLRGLAEGALVLAALPCPPLVTVVSAAPYLRLPADEDRINPLHRRQELRRQVKRIEGEGAVYRVADGSDLGAFERALTDLRCRHRAQWGEHSGLMRSYARFASAVRQGAATGAVRVHELHVDGDVVATEVTLDVAGRRHHYQSGRDTTHRWRGAGKVLVNAVIQGALADGCVELDFLRGPEPYKYDWTDTDRRVRRARAARGTPARAALRALAVAERARPAGRAVKAKVRGQRARTRGRSG